MDKPGTLGFGVSLSRPRQAAVVAQGTDHLHLDGQIVDVEKQDVGYEEQTDIHVYLMRRFLKVSGFDPAGGDKLIYIKGTEVHTKETEEKIALELNAEYLHAHDFVDLTINNRRIWFLHQGPGAGFGHTAGDGLRNWLKSIYWDRLNNRQFLPDMIVTGHYHKGVYNSYIQNRNDGVAVLHGMILPSWQDKTRYAYSRVPAAINRIGAAFVEISARGAISTLNFCLWLIRTG